MLDSLPFVERHAWFAGHSGKSKIHTELFDTKNELTIVGNVFRDFLKPH